MKKLSYFLLNILLMGSIFVSCDPMTEKGPSEGQEVITADQLDITATPIVVNGKNTNKIVVQNHSKVMSHWSAPQLIEDSTQSSLAGDTMYVTKTGNNGISFAGRNLSCSVTKKLSTSVDIITYLSDGLKTRLCITGSEGNYKPAKDGAPSSFENTDFDVNKVKVVQEMTQDGLKGNRLTVYNANPHLSNWSFGSSTLDKNVGSIFVTDVGTYTLSLTYTKADGTSKTVEIGQYTIEGMSYVPEVLANLFGASGEKTWQWDDTSANGVWGNGGYMGSTHPDWWKVSFAGIDEQAAGKGTIAGDGSGATFTVNLKNKTFVKNNGASGTLSYDLDDIVSKGWNTGSLKLKGVNIPMGYLVNNGNAIPDKYYILSVSTSSSLVLCAPEPGAGSWGTAWFWMFKPQN